MVLRFIQLTSQKTWILFAFIWNIVINAYVYLKNMSCWLVIENCPLISFKIYTDFLDIKKIIKKTVLMNL